MPDSIAEISLDLLKVLERYLNVGYRNRDFNASLATYLATLSDPSSRREEDEEGTVEVNLVGLRVLVA